MIRRGEIYWVALDPTVGAEIRKTRPAVVVSSDANNIHAQTVTVLPMTEAANKAYPAEVLIKPGTFGNRDVSKIKAHQIRTVDKRRMGKLVGQLSAKRMNEVDAAMRLHLALA